MRWRVWRNGLRPRSSSPLGLGSGVWALRAIDSTIADVISLPGQMYLAFQVMQAYPSCMSGGENPLLKVQGANVVEFAQTLLPGLPFWKSAN